MLLIVAGRHGYISPSWYTHHATPAPTWNFSAAHCYGMPEILDGEENLRVLTCLVDHFEQHVEAPVHLDQEIGARLARGTVCLFDVRMPELDGIEATRLLAGPDVDDPMAIVVITTFDLDEYVHGALKAGARLLKDAGPQLLVQAIHSAANGDALIAPNVTARCWPRSPARSRTRRRPSRASR